MDTYFLTLDDVLEIHRHQIGKYGGSEGVRDLGLLESALSMPRAGFGGQFLHADLFDKASAYLFHIAKNHPFIDGNKRTAAVSTIAFLRFNGFELDADEKEFEAIVLAVAQSQVEKPEAADFLRRNARTAI